MGREASARKFRRLYNEETGEHSMHLGTAKEAEVEANLANRMAAIGLISPKIIVPEGS